MALPSTIVFPSQLPLHRLSPTDMQASPLTYLQTNALGLGAYRISNRPVCSTKTAAQQMHLSARQVYCTAMQHVGVQGQEAAAYPSAAASRVLQRPLGASMLAAVSMPMVAGSSVTRAAVTRQRPALPSFSSAHARLVADRDEEQAVSMDRAGPAHAPTGQPLHLDAGCSCCWCRAVGML